MVQSLFTIAIASFKERKTVGAFVCFNKHLTYDFD